MITIFVFDLKLVEICSTWNCRGEVDQSVVVHSITFGALMSKQESSDNFCQQCYALMREHQVTWFYAAKTERTYVQLNFKRNEKLQIKSWEI